MIFHFNMSISDFLYNRKKKAFLDFLNKHDAPLSLSKEFTSDKEVMLKVIEKRSSYMMYAQPTLLSDYDFVMSAVKINGEVLQYVADELRDNEDIVSNAIKTSPKSIKYATDRLKKNKDLAIMAVSVFGYCLQYLPYLSEEKDVVLAAVKDSGECLAYASKIMCDDKDVIMESVKSRGGSLDFASKRLKNDFDVVYQAVMQNPTAINFASKNYQKIALGLDPWWVMTKLKFIKEKGYEINFDEKITTQCRVIEDVEKLKNELKVTGIEGNKKIKV